jgi:putative transposase
MRHDGLGTAREQRLRHDLQEAGISGEHKKAALKGMTPGSLLPERLLKLAEPLGNAIRDLISIVTYRTFLRWKSEKRPGRTPTRGPGRPRKPEDLRQLVVRMARENGWGYTRILAELDKMKAGKICRTTIRNILVENGFDVGPKRGQGTWDELVRIHLKALWATDFFTKEVWTAFGKVTYYVLFFIHVGSRRVHVAGMTPNPDGPWMANCARNMRLVFQDEGAPSYILRDGDPKFTAQFEAIIESEGAVLKRLPFRAPNLNPYAERWVGLFKQECLDRFMVFGERHLRHIVESYAAYYNAGEAEQGRGLPAHRGGRDARARVGRGPERRRLRVVAWRHPETLPQGGVADAQGQPAPPPVNAAPCAALRSCLRRPTVRQASLLVFLLGAS